MQTWAPRADRVGETTELSVVEAVLWACEQSEDEMEVGDLVEAVLLRSDVVVRSERAAPARLRSEPREAISPLP